MLRRTKTSKSGEHNIDNDDKKEERSQYQTVWIIALILIVGFILLMNEKKYIMLFHVRNFLGVTFTIEGRDELAKEAAQTAQVVGRAAHSDIITATPAQEKVVAPAVKVAKVAQAKVARAQTVADDTCEWREDQLVGRCFGLQNQKGKFPTQQSCEEYCCKIGWDCITYQWRKDRGCFIGDIVRLGSENAPTGNWCEPTKPSEWIGKRIASRLTTGCTFESENLGGQCYGLGVQKPPKTPKGCEKLCCETEKCTVWQFRADKGCFVGKSNNCDSDVTAWSGRRKPTPEWRAKGRKRPKDS
jgi:hypothetical protein